MPDGLAARQARDRRASRSAMPRACPPTTRRSTRAADVLRDSSCDTPPNAGGGLLELLKGAGIGQRILRPVARRQAAAARPLHPERRRFPRRLVRERAVKARLRVRRHRRHLRRALHPGHGLRSAASLLRRGQRQARRLGPRDRRHGRDHAGDGRGGPSTRRRIRTGRGGRASRDRGRPRRRRGARRRRGDRARARLPPMLRPSSCSAICVPEERRRAGARRALRAASNPAPAPSA